MKKNKLYLILAIITAVFLFATAAICNQCSPGEELTLDEEPPPEEEPLPEEEPPPEEEPAPGEEEPLEEEPPPEEESAEEELSAPTIDIEIYEGPLYSEADEVCYYRVKAIVTGNPTPEVEFSEDDSFGAWGKRKCQINLESPSETYTLTATATNSEGTATDSITLSWGCEEPEPEPEPEVTEVEATIVADEDLSGNICGYDIGDAVAVTDTDTVYIGDDTDSRYIKGYLTFNIGDLSDLEYITIKEAVIIIPEIENRHEPWWDGSEMNIKVFDYGPSLDPIDFRLGGVTVKVFSTSLDLTNLTFSTPELKDELESYISSGKELFQLKFGLNGRSINTTADGYWFLKRDASLYVKYDTIE